jgi:D-hydantoinase
MLFQNATLVLPDRLMRGDLRTENGKIAAIGVGLSTGGEEIVDCAGKLLFPGFIDTHTHLDMGNPLSHTAGDFASETRAALLGGTTCILDFATQERGETLQEGLANWRKLAEKGAFCHYSFHMAVTDWSEQTRCEMAEMVAAGITSFKLYMAYGHLRISDADALAVLREAKRLGALVGMHCELGDAVVDGVAAQKAAGNFAPTAHPLSRPDWVEAEAIRRWIALGKAADCPIYVVHLSTALGLEEIRRGRAEGVTVLAETCPQYLLLDEDRYDLPDFEGAKYVLSPPLRGQADMDALWQAVRSGEIDFIGTDHCGFHFATDKMRGRDDFSHIPNGMPGVEHRPALLYTHGVKAGRIDEVRLAQLLATRPAEVFGMESKGSLAVGKDADLVVWNPETVWMISAETQHQSVDYTPYEGFEMVGAAERVYLCGVRTNGDAPQGRYVARAAFF